MSEKILGAPIETEDRDTTVICPECGHQYGLYHHGVRNDFCRRCPSRKARAGDRDAQKLLIRLDRRRNEAKAASQAAGSAQLNERRSNPPLFA